MFTVLPRMKKNLIGKQLYICDPKEMDKYLMFSVSDERLDIKAGTTEDFGQPTKRIDFKVISFDVNGDLLEKYDFGEIPDEERAKNRLYCALLELYRSIKDNQVFSDNRIIHGSNFFQLEPTVEGFRIKVYIDLRPDFFSENQFHSQMNLDSNHYARAFYAFYEELNDIAEQEVIPPTLMASLGRLISAICGTIVRYDPSTGKLIKGKVKRLGPYPNN